MGVFELGIVMRNTLRKTISELFADLKNDPKMRILFVEGNRDLAFLREIVPLHERKDTVVYSIGVIEVEVETGGERGRLFRLAEIVNESDFSLRIRFFADADCDRLLAKNVLENVTMTDARDLESYTLSESGFEKLWLTGMAGAIGDEKKLFSSVIRLAKPIGILRVVSEKYQMDLPFQRLFEKGWKRFLTGSRFYRKLDIKKLMRTLLQIKHNSLKEYEALNRIFEAEQVDFSQFDSNQIVHGKDLIGILEVLIGIDRKHVETMLYLSLNYDEVRSYPNIMQIYRWITR
jgi:hypothetical protein